MTLDECRPVEVWESEFKLMDLIGMETILVRETIDQGLQDAYYPTGQPDVWSSCGYDRVGTLMRLAEDHGMRVYLGLIHRPGTSSPSPAFDREAFLYSNVVTVRELAGLYGDSPAFAGWYLTPEVAANNWVVDRDHYTVDFHRRLIAAVREFDQHPIAAAPWFLPDSTYVAIAPEQLAAFAQDYTTRIGVNILILQDGIGGGRDFPEVDSYFNAVAQGLSGSNAQFWADVEAFSIEGDGAFTPADPSRLEMQTASVAPYVDQIVTWTFQHYMSPNSPRAGAWEAYVRYITHTEASR
ncbi:MAG: DUF4434 domain-containing protein [Dehalococcoidia bacterium]|nr:DUF4434 domain-containing protein [Dehalococcoidia bacterium]